MTSESKRLFIGIELDLQVTENLVLVQEDLQAIIKSRGAKVRWVAPENLHLTLRFLGETNGAFVQGIQENLELLAAQWRPFRVEMAGIGAFPDAQRPRILYAASHVGAETLCELSAAIVQALLPFGFPRDARPFLPHVTLGRVKTTAKRIDLSDAEQALHDINFGPSLIREIVLFHSTLGKKGPTYEVVSRHLFREKSRRKETSPAKTSKTNESDRNGTTESYPTAEAQAAEPPPPNAE